MLSPTPYVVIDGVEIPAGLDANGDFESVVAGRFSITWGREDYMDQPQAGTAAVTIFDKLGAYASEGDIIGLTVVIGMRWPGKNQIIFRGRITDAELIYVRTKVGNVFGLELSCTDKLGELGQTYVANQTWPSEYYPNRIDRIMTAGANKIVAGIGGGLSPTLNTTDTGDTTLLSLVQDAMEGVGDRMAYDPATNRVEAIGRLTISGHTLRLALNDSGMYGVELDSGYSEEASIPSTGLQVSAGMRRSIASGITEVRVGHSRFDMATEQRGAFVSVKSTGLNETRLGRRVLKVDTQLYDVKLSTGEVINDVWIQRLLDEYVDMALQEGRQWSPPPLTWDSRLNGGFRSEAEMFALLRCTEKRHPVYFPQSVYNDVGTQPPIYRIIGGTVEYIAGKKKGWISTVNLGPVKVNQNAAVTWETINTSTTETVTWELLDDSVTGNSLAYVTQGVD